MKSRFDVEYKKIMRSLVSEDTNDPAYQAQLKADNEKAAQRLRESQAKLAAIKDEATLDREAANREDVKAFVSEVYNNFKNIHYIDYNKLADDEAAFSKFKELYDEQTPEVKVGFISYLKNELSGYLSRGSDIYVDRSTGYDDMENPALNKKIASIIKLRDRLEALNA